ncbi:diaminopimelate epimerase [Shouchella lonarensis]|uniref:Diaminopimelate epimerase n=1 Tax=Shouchella lonarensis TaxID=1464122 RepID=A0A1G6HJ77_9BACI|nr:diaminopimelate epimerase [Shouchella lonarensis]SDB94203.1 diaminopimelate epimerase [Shouchella lonarensis]
MKFTKMHGLGNSYIYVNLFEEVLEEESLRTLAINLSNRNTGIGSDGLILIGPSERADVRMRIFNLDGSEAKNCGNGLRCVAKYSFEHGLVSAEKFCIETLGGIVSVTVHINETRIVETVTVNMGTPVLARNAIPMLGEGKESVVNEEISVGGETAWITAVSMGNPHAVLFVPDVEPAPVATFGKALSTDERFPDGVNVEFVEVLSSTEYRFRVWERGSGMTEACGTGACAAVVAGVLNGHTKQGEPVCVHLPGGDLTITWAVDGTVHMQGPAAYICTGEAHM